MSQRYNFGRGCEGPPIGLSTAELNRMDISYQSPTVFDHEKLWVENGALVGRTATVADNRVTPTNGNVPNGVPPFRTDDERLLKAANSTSLLLIEELDLHGQTLSQQFGTAFFVAPNKVLTAGHCTLGVKNTRVRVTVSRPLIQGPIDVTDFANRKTETIECEVVDSLYTKEASIDHDISLLSSGNYKSPEWLELSTTELEPEAVVDVVGYPGRHTTQFILAHQELTTRFRESVAAAEILLPAQELTITRGKVKSIGNTVSYQLTTCPGMSGSSLLHNGKAYGVHVGQVDKTINSLPMSVAFTGPDVCRFLQRWNLV